MHRVRYYSHLYEPARFQKGVRGWVIRVLNRFRLWLEIKVAKQVMIYLAMEQKVEGGALVALGHRFDADAAEETALLGSPVAPELPESGRISDRPPAPAQIDPTLAMIGRMSQKKGAKRYTSGKYYSAVNESDITAVPQVTAPPQEVSL